jgi:AbrB family looped-hinge helix DNA binding protein
MTVSQVSEKGQITLPAHARRRLGIQPHDRVSIETEADAIIIKRVADFFRLEGVLGEASLDEEEKAMEEVAARGGRKKSK